MGKGSGSPEIWGRGGASRGAEMPSYSASLFPSPPRVLPVASGSPVAVS